MNPRIIRSGALSAVGEYERRVILSHTERVLRQAEAIDSIPTPLEEVRRAAGVEELVDIRELPQAISAQKPAWLGRVIGAYVFPRRTVFIDTNLPEPRLRFTDGHEITHAILPTHRRAYSLDDKRIFEDVVEYLDLEANVGASYLLFQGHRFHQRALQFETSIETPKSFAEVYSASAHSTIRFYVEEHPEPVALVISGRYPDLFGRLPAWTHTESQAFFEQFGSVADQVGPSSLNLARDNAWQVPAARLTRAAAESLTRETIREEVALTDLRGDRQPFVAEAWFNGYVHFLMLVPRRRLRLGRRVQTIAT